MSFLFAVTQVTETRTGPLGCSNYDNLDSVSSVLVQSPENKVQLQGLYMILWLSRCICKVLTFVCKVWMHEVNSSDCLAYKRIDA